MKKRKPSPGSSWRLAAHQRPPVGCKMYGSAFNAGSDKAPSGRTFNTRDSRGTIFDELVIDGWLHLEQMDKRSWWMRLGPMDMWLTVEKDGKLAVTLREIDHDAGTISGLPRLLTKPGKTKP